MAAPPYQRYAQNMYDIAFSSLVEQLERPLFKEMYGFLIKSLQDQYRVILHELGVKTADEYRSSTLKLKLQQHFGKRVSIISQSSGSGFICASTVPLSDALEKLKHLEVELHKDEKYHTLQCAATIRDNTVTSLPM